MHEVMVDGQRWGDLPVPDLGSWTPQDRVAVILPARDNQLELDRTLAALLHQSYPQELLEVVVVDDASGTPLTVPPLAPSGTRVVRRDDASSHGSGAARHAGAQASAADILLFLDSDMLADAHHVEAHARWHHICRHALALGYKWFVDVQGVTPADIDRVGREENGLHHLLEGPRWRKHDWQVEQIQGRDGLTHDDDDAFLTVVGATLSVRRDLYERAGGFATFGLRGIVDTEFGYRAHARGAVIIPDKQAKSWHQGARNFATRGGEIKRARMGLAANHLPLPMFRLQNTGRRWAVPLVRVVVEPGPQAGDWSDGDTETLLLTVDSVLASDVTDLAVTVVTGGSELPRWWLDYVEHETRVDVADTLPDSGFPSPFTVVTRPGVRFSTDTISRGLALLSEEVRMVQTLPDPYGTSLEIWRTRTLERARLTGATDTEPAVGRRWCAPDALGIGRVRPRISPQGMVGGW